jgi:hypothetical protein
LKRVVDRFAKTILEHNKRLRSDHGFMVARTTTITYAASCR